MVGLWQWRTRSAAGQPAAAASDPPKSSPSVAIEGVHAETDLGVFLETVNHELRTPLNAILGFSDLLLEEIDGPLSDERRQSLEIIRDSGGTLLSLFDDVTELIALMGGQVARGDTAVDLGERVRVAGPVLAGDIELGATEGAYGLVGDPERLGRAVDEVLGLAAARAVGSRPHARVSSDGDRVRLSVEVVCKPPAAEELTTLSTPPPTPAARMRGGGVGPSIAAHVARLHGGDLVATATSTGLKLEFSARRVAP